MHEMEFAPDLKAIARAGAGVNNIPLEKCAEQGIVVFNTPGANANGVKELVIAGMLLASRDIIGGINWVQENEEDGNIAKDAEKAKKAFAGQELEGKKLGVIGLGAIGVLVADVYKRQHRRRCKDISMVQVRAIQETGSRTFKDQKSAESFRKLKTCSAL